MVLRFYWLEILILSISVSFILPIICLAIVLLSWKFSARNQRLKVQKRHCLVLGGRQGLGKAMALELVKQGAHVTIVARNETNLQDAIEDLSMYQTRDQIIQYYSVDLMQYSKCVELYETLIKNGHSPDWLICTQGAAKPGFINDQTIQDFEFMMDANYTSSVNAVKALMQVTKNYCTSKSLDSKNNLIAGISPDQRQLLPNRIIFTGSVLSLLSMIGYSAYSSSRYAMRGFADSLRSELTPLGIQVHFMMPGLYNIDKVIWILLDLKKRI